MNPIYLDNNATTAMHPEVAGAMEQCFRAGWGNPASPHFAGRQARRVLEEAREGVASILGARLGTRNADAVIFTSGGTEANNLALHGLGGEAPGPIVISAIEHPSVVASAEKMRMSRHQEVIRLPVNRHGVLQLAALTDPLLQGVRLVSVMLGNNETGVLQPVREVAELCRARGVPLHTDAVQCVGKIPVNFRELGVDALTLSAHKFHGPVGIGALIVRAGVPLTPMLAGGFQQAGLRPGTESVPLVVGLFRALQLWHAEREQRSDYLCQRRDELEQELLRRCPGIIVHGKQASRLPQTSNIAFPGLDRQALVMAFDLDGVACSTGSACASGSSEPSPVLQAMGLPPAVIQGSLRFSVSSFTTQEEVIEAAHRISLIVHKLQIGGKSAIPAAAPPKHRVTPV